MGPPKFDVRKWERATKAVAVPGDEAWGWTTVHNPPSYPSGSITTRCVRSNGWETPYQVDESAKPALSLTRFAPTPMLSARFDPHNELSGSHSNTMAMPREGIYKDASAKAWLNQEASRCPFAVDRRFVSGSWLYNTSYLYKSRPIPDRRYLEMHTRRPITQSKHVTYSRAKSTQQVVRLIAQKVNERAKSNGVAARAVTQKHPLRAFMSKDREKKGYLTPSEVRDALETWNITLQHDDVDRLIDAFSYKPPMQDTGFDPIPSGTEASVEGGEGQALFDYKAFVQTLNALTNAHPLGGHAGNSWGWMT